MGERAIRKGKRSKYSIGGKGGEERECRKPCSLFTVPNNNLNLRIKTKPIMVGIYSASDFWARYM